jgi:hypothetical protein
MFTFPSHCPPQTKLHMHQERGSQRLGEGGQKISTHCYCRCRLWRGGQGWLGWLMLMLWRSERHWLTVMTWGCPFVVVIVPENIVRKKIDKWKKHTNDPKHVVWRALGLASFNPIACPSSAVCRLALSMVVVTTRMWQSQLKNVVKNNIRLVQIYQMKVKWKHTIGPKHVKRHVSGHYSLSFILELLLLL